MEFFHNALDLRYKLTNLLLRDFGVKEKIRDLRVLSGIKAMSVEDFNTLNDIAARYNYSQPILEKYPNWLIDYFRTNILNELHSLMKNIVSANTIYITNIAEYYRRRHYQTESIMNCENLLQELQFIVNVLPCDINKFTPYVEQIEFEIKLLKGWRKSNNKHLNHLNKSQKQN